MPYVEASTCGQDVAAEALHVRGEPVWPCGSCSSSSEGRTERITQFTGSSSTGVHRVLIGGAWVRKGEVGAEPTCAVAAR